MSDPVMQCRSTGQRTMMKHMTKEAVPTSRVRCKRERLNHVATGYHLCASLNTENAAATLRERRSKQSVLKLDMKCKSNLRSQLPLRNICTVHNLSMLCQRAKQQSIQGVGMSAADKTCTCTPLPLGAASACEKAWSSGDAPKAPDGSMLRCKELSASARIDWPGVTPTGP